MRHEVVIHQIARPLRARALGVVEAVAAGGGGAEGEGEGGEDGGEGEAHGELVGLQKIVSKGIRALTE